MTEQELIEQAIANGTDLPGRTGQADTQHTYYDTTTGQPYFKKVGGGKSFIPPATAMAMFNDPKALKWAEAQGYVIKGGAQGLEDASKGVVGPDGKTRFGPSPVTMASQSGGLWHTTGQWNSETGQFDHDLDLGNILTMVVAGVITAGVASAIMAGAGIPPAVVDSTLAATTTGGAQAGTAVLGSAGFGAAGAESLGAITGVSSLGAEAGVDAGLSAFGIAAPVAATGPALTAGVAGAAAAGGAGGATLANVIPQSSASLAGTTSATAPVVGMGGGAPVLAPATETALNTIGPAAAKASVWGGLGSLAGTKTAVDAGTTLLGAYLQSRAAGNAAEANAAAQDKQLAYLREVEAAQEKEFYSTQQQNQQQFASTQQLNLNQYNRRAANLEPYVQIGHNANATLNSMMGYGAFAPYQPVALTAPGPYGAPAASQQGPPASGTNYQAAFQKLTGGQEMDDASLKALAQTPEFKAAGFTLTPDNAKGFATKVGANVGTPNEQWFRVLDGDPSTKRATVFIPQNNAGGASGPSAGSPSLATLMSMFGTQIENRPSVVTAPIAATPTLASLYSSSYSPAALRSPTVYA